MPSCHDAIMFVDAGLNFILASTLSVFRPFKWHGDTRSPTIALFVSPSLL